MKIKTSLTLAEDVIAAIDERTAKSSTRSAFVEVAVRAYLQKLSADEIEKKERLLLDSRAAAMNAEMEDILSYQALP